MAETVRVDAAVYASVVNALYEQGNAAIARTLKSAVVEGPQPGDVFDKDSEEPAGVVVVADSELDQWTRREGGWVIASGSPIATPWPWRRVQSYFGPLTVIS